MKVNYLFLLVSLLLPCLMGSMSQEERLDFLNQHLKDLNSPLMAMQKKDGSIGLFARRKLKKNSPILTMPESMTLSSFDDFPRSYFFYEMGGQQQPDMLAGHLLYTKYFEKGAWNYNYFINQFDKQGLNLTAGYWTQEDYQFFMRHIGYFAEHDFDLKEYTRKLKGIIVNNWPHLDQYNPKFPEEIWAYAMITKYAIPMNRWSWFELHGLDKNKWRRKVPGLGDNPKADYSQNIPGYAMIPFLDLISYESIPFKGKYKLSEVFAVDNPEVENYLQSIGIPEPRNAELDIKGEGFEEDKFMDLLYFDNPGLNELSNLVRYGYRKVTLLANRNYQKGEEIRYLRNRFSNHDLLVNTGELVAQNYFDASYFVGNFPKFQEEHFKFCYEIDCAPRNTSEYIYHFHRFQANHRFIKYLRVLIMVEDKLRGEGETPNPFDLEAARRVMNRGYFNSPFREILVWKYYFIAVNSKFFVQRSTIVEDRAALASLEDNKENELRRKMLMNCIQEKEIGHRHVQFALQKWSKVMVDKLLLGQIKMQILGMVEKQDKSQPAFFTYSPLE